jgi:co-chaperonin GroES (HSP10)
MAQDNVSVTLRDVPVEYWPRPRGEWVLLQRPEVLAESAGGIALLRESAMFLALEQTCGKVLEIGPEAYVTSHMAVPSVNGPYCKVGDWVVYALNQGQEVKVDVDGETITFMLIHASHVRAVTESPEKTKTGLSR